MDGPEFELKIPYLCEDKQYLNETYILQITKKKLYMDYETTSDTDPKSSCSTTIHHISFNFERKKLDIQKFNICSYKQEKTYAEA
jgi:hypothetical protein